MKNFISKAVIPTLGLLCASFFVFIALPVAAANNASFVSQSVPTAMEAGKTYQVSVKMKNTGTTTWAGTGTSAHRLGSQNSQDNGTWGFNRVNLVAGESVLPGASKNFTFTVTAPSTAGIYNFQWQMVQEFVQWFGSKSTNVAVTVNDPASAALMTNVAVTVNDPASAALMTKMKTKGCIVAGMLNTSDFDLNLINRSGCEYIHRAVDMGWGLIDFNLVQSRMANVMKSGITYDMFISEAVRTNDVYYFPDENRNFNFSAMCKAGTLGAWGANTCIPSYASDEYRKYLRYITRKAIDMGIQSYSFAQVYMGDNLSNPILPSIITELRTYAASKGKTIAVGGQTNSISDETYLRKMDYVIGGLGEDDQGNLETGSCSSKWNDPPNNPCWALLFNQPWLSMANNVLIHPDWDGRTNSDADTFAHMTTDLRTKFLTDNYTAFKAKGVGFLLPYGIPVVSRLVCGSSSYGSYTPDNNGPCKDEGVMNSILGMAKKADGSQCGGDSECSSGNCADGGTCCASGKCGWGFYPNTECVADGGKKNNEYLNGVCRAGTWKTVAGGIGCNSFACDSGTCTSNKCVASSCANGCSTSGTKQCSGNGYRTCGNYDTDSCLEWSSATACGTGQTCSGGTCQAAPSTANLSVYEATLETQGCGGDGMPHLFCRASRYCQSQSYTAGFQTEWGVPAVVACVKGANLSVSYTTLEAQGCGGAVDGIPYLFCRATRYCASQGYSAGFQIEWGTNANIACVNGTALSVSYATLEAQGCGGDVNGEPHLFCRASRYCASQGYVSGFQTEWGTNATVVFVL